MKSLRRIVTGLLVCAAVSFNHSAQAQAFPTKPVRMIVPTGAGGGLDLVARQLAQKLSELWARGVFVENRVGAGGTIGVDAVAKAAPDGYTLAVVATSFVINASVYSKLPYDSLRDFAPVTMISLTPLILVANPSLPVRSVNDLVALAKAKPGQVNYSSTGTGGGVHLSIEMMRGLTGIDVVHIPYKATVAAVTDVVEGRVQFTVTGLPVAMPLIAAGRLRALAIAGTRRSASLPELPTILESVPNYAFNNWLGILAPAKTPGDVLAQLHGDIVRALQSEDLRQKMLAQGDEPTTMSSAQFSELIRQEIARYSILVKSLGARID